MIASQQALPIQHPAPACLARQLHAGRPAVSHPVAGVRLVSMWLRDYQLVWFISYPSAARAQHDARTQYGPHDHVATVGAELVSAATDAEASAAARAVRHCL
jgi:hypothetical protein